MSSDACYGEFNVRLGSYRESRNVQGSTYWKLRAAYKSNVIRHAVIDRKVWLIRSQVDDFLASFDSKPQQPASHSAAMADISTSKDIKRIAAAVEDIAIAVRQAIAALSSTTH